MKQLFAVGLGIFLLVSHSRGALYTGNGNTSDGGAVGLGSLSLSDNGTTVSMTLTKGSGSFNDVLVLFIDSKSGGFTTTSQFSDNSSALAISISGLNSQGSARSTANFATGFAADYAVVMSVNQGAAVYQLANGPSFGDPIRTLHAPFENPNTASYSIAFDWVDIGRTKGPGNGFTFESSYITATGSRSLESFETYLSGSASGFNTVNFGNYDTYGVVAVPETTNAALAVFGAGALGIGLFRRARRSRSKRG